MFENKCLPITGNGIESFIQRYELLQNCLHIKRLLNVSRKLRAFFEKKNVRKGNLRQET